MTPLATIMEWGTNLRGSLFRTLAEKRGPGSPRQTKFSPVQAAGGAGGAERARSPPWLIRRAASIPPSSS